MSNTDNASCFVPDFKSYCDEDNTLMRNFSGMNLPEKILFVIDTAKEKNCTPFKLSTGASYTPLFMIKRTIENFIYIKSIIQHSHEYALMILNSHSSRWICDFTNNTNSIVNHLNLINDDFLEEDQKSYDLGQSFDEIQQKLLLLTKKYETTVPTFVIRVILVYSRSNSIPKFHIGKRSLDTLIKNPYFFIDVLYVHEPPCSENLCEEIYSEIATLDTTNFSYILEVGRNAAKLHDSMAKLLAHPLQRPPQKDVCYTICSPSASQETCNNV
ncbi:BRISC and BRCA1-A complex member 1-like [Apis cerana]|uniref:BRCA1-A complex subunit MERIT40 n=1 Tax=Apis cerana cerana TaxID=94128 RepID=A0A2A3EE98_APICC|nr:BRISC and BRCA1-A complex member 1-like [Apis cerana]PBC30038.1 BRCA1-A complex subunit MERIT40 [Apis cerana cerana]